MAIQTTLRSAEGLRGYTIHATDDEIGKVDQFLFDDHTWTIRYLVVNTGNWLLERLVLISPLSLESVDWDRRRLNVKLTRQQVKESPDIATDEPVSRQQETEYLQYYGYPPYWEGPGLWGESMFPLYSGYAGATIPPSEMMPMAESPVDDASANQESKADPHLRSTHEVVDYHLQAQDGEIGHVTDFIVDDTTWSIRYMVVDTRNWWPGKKVLVAPQWIQSIRWAGEKVAVDLTRVAIKSAPEYDPARLLNREYETQLHQHYQRPVYWQKPTGE